MQTQRVCVRVSKRVKRAGAAASERPYAIVMMSSRRLRPALAVTPVLLVHAETPKQVASSQKAHTHISRAPDCMQRLLAWAKSPYASHHQRADLFLWSNYLRDSPINRWPHLHWHACSTTVNFGGKNSFRSGKCKRPVGSPTQQQ